MIHFGSTALPGDVVTIGWWPLLLLSCPQIGHPTFYGQAEGNMKGVLKYLGTIP